MKMKAVICTKYGPPEVLKLGEVAKPAPGKKEVCIKIHATSVTSSDTIVRSFKLSRWHPVGFLMGLVLGFKRPRNPVLGMIIAGEIESVGDAVTRFKVGEPVFGSTVKSATQIQFGTYAQYKCLAEDSMIVSKPSNVTYEEAAAIPYGADLALYFLNKGKIENGQKVLIIGASGSVGTSAVQLAGHFGAEVTGVCSTANLELVKSLGARKVIDYTREDINESGEQYDLVLDAVPMAMADRKKIKKKHKNLLKGTGKYVSVDKGSPKPLIENMQLIKQLVESGELKPVIDRTYPLDQIVEAHQYVDTGRKKGNVVIKVSHDQ